jgi:TPR repeat protein
MAKTWFRLRNSINRRPILGRSMPSRVSAGACYAEACGVARDLIRAAKPYQLRLLGLAYEYGSGVKKDAALAEKCYHRAADLGDEDARRKKG